MIAKFRGPSLKISPSEVIRPQRPRKAQLTIKDKNKNELIKQQFFKDQYGSLDSDL